MSGMGKLISYEAVSAKDVERDLQQRYGQRFEVIDVERGGVRPSGRVQPDGFLVRAEDGTQFRYIEHHDGEIDDYYLNMRFGNEYFEWKLKSLLDEVFGSGNYAAQAVWYKRGKMSVIESLNTYNYKEDKDVTISLFLAVKADEVNYEKEAEKIRFVYDSITDVDSRMMLAGYLKSMPDDMDTFMAYETTGLNNLFSAMYGEAVETEVFLSSSFESEVLEIENIATQLQKNSGRK